MFCILRLPETLRQQIDDEELLYETMWMGFCNLKCTTILLSDMRKLELL